MLTRTLICAYGWMDGCTVRWMDELNMLPVRTLKGYEGKTSAANSSGSLTVSEFWSLSEWTSDSDCVKEKASLELQTFLLYALVESCRRI